MQQLCSQDSFSKSPPHFDRYYNTILNPSSQPISASLVNRRCHLSSSGIPHLEPCHSQTANPSHFGFATPSRIPHLEPCRSQTAIPSHFSFAASPPQGFPTLNLAALMAEYTYDSSHTLHTRSLTHIMRPHVSVMFSKFNFRL